MGFLSRPPAISRKAVVAASAAMVLAAGVLLQVTKNTPTGPTSGRPIQCWSTSSDGQVGCVDETGNLTLSGSVTANGVTLTAGTSQAGGDARYVTQSGDTMTGGLLIQNGGTPGTIDTGFLLEIAGAASGRILHAQDQLRSSGSLVAEGTVTFASLASCSGIQTSALGVLSCGNGGLFTSTGALSTYFDKRYVAVAGDTMTGGLLLVQGGAGTQTIDAGVLLEIAGTMSGRTIMATDTLNASGTVIIKKRAGSSTGNILIVDTKGLVYDATNKRVGVGTAAPKTAFEIIGTASGSNAPTFSALKSCTSIQTDANGAFSCGSGAAEKIVLLGTITGGSGNIGASSTAENAVTPTFTGTNSISANTLTQGATIRVRFTGQYQVAAGTLKVRIKLGGGSTNLFIVNSVNGANTAYSAYVDFFLTSAPGAAATIAQGGMFNGNQAATVINSVSLSASNATSVPATFAADTTGALAVTFTEQFSSSNASNIFSIDNGSITYELL